MRVQRGSLSLTGTDLASEFELSIPAPVGYSFIVSSVRSSMIEPDPPPEGDIPEDPDEHGGDVLFSAQLVREVLWEPEIEPSLSKTMCKVELTDVVGDNYTKIKATRLSYFEGHNTTVDWQVIYGDEFAVQTGSTDCNDEDLSVIEAISSVDLGSAFIVHTNSTNCEYGSHSFFSTEFNEDGDEVVFNRYYGESGDINSIQWYVVEWDGASVYRSTTELIDSTASVNIESVDRDKSFLLYSYNSDADEDNSDSNTAALVFFKGAIAAEDEVLFTTYADISSNNMISFFVIEHPDLHVHYGDVTVTGYSSSVTLDSIVNISGAFMATSQLGNAYNDEYVKESLNCGYNTHRLSKEGDDYNVIIARERVLEGSIYASWFVVGYTVELPTVSTSACSEITFTSFKASGNVTDTGSLDISRRGFCYLRNITGTPTMSDSVVYEEGEFEAGEYSLNVTGLGTARNYRVRAFAENMLGISYGNTVSCTTDSTEMCEFIGTAVEDIGIVNKYKTPRH